MRCFLVYWVNTDKETGKRYGMTSTVYADNFDEAYTKARECYSEITQIVRQSTYGDTDNQY